ncbi:MAG: hypothetical protein GY711_06850 [bacterium]|nr:hypothetical protein [bacterium]
MKSPTRNILTACSIAAALCLGFVACKGTTTAELDADTVIGRGRVKVTHTNPPDQLNMDKLPCDVDVEFTDADGNSLGTTTGVSEGEAVPVPDGATHVTISGPSDGGSAPGPVAYNAPDRLGHTALVEPDFYLIVSAPIDMLDDPADPEWGASSNKMLALWLDEPKRLWTQDELMALTLQLLLAADPTTATVPGRWEVEYFHFFEPLTVAGIPYGGNIHSYDNVLQSLGEWPLYDATFNGATLPQYGTAENNGWTVRSSFLNGVLVTNPGFNSGSITTQDLYDLNPNVITGAALIL